MHAVPPPVLPAGVPAVPAWCTHPALQRLLHDALASAGPLMERVCDATRVSLLARQDTARTPGEHQAMHEARLQLTQLAGVISARYPGALSQALAQSGAPAASTHHGSTGRALSAIHFDDLELMDDRQINDSVERARARQIVLAATEGPLADLDALVCSVQGLARVLPDHNPLRPDLFLQALQTVLAQMQVPAQVRNDWMAHMAQALGKELRSLYLATIDKLRSNGQQPMGYGMRQANGQVYYAAPAGGSSPGFASHHDLAPLPPQAESLLTLERLRALLLGNARQATAAPAPPANESFADRFSREFEHGDALPTVDAPTTDFAITIPAAFEALQEMNQVAQMMERLGQPRPGGSTSPAPPHPGADGLSQALSMEVVTLMVDNIARDTRLLWPVQQFVRALEPALLQLALADPRFFSHREHAARRLLQEMTDRSLAYNALETPGFQRFMKTLMEVAGPLATLEAATAQAFEEVLLKLQNLWQQSDQARKKERARAIETLHHAEKRHLLAAQISRDLWLLPDIANVPEPIFRFLQGPWPQVIAQARLTDTTGHTDPGRYREVVDALIWSTQPELTRTSTGQLARLLPKLLAKLRDGLASIDYPAEKTEAVFEALMQAHQQAFNTPPAAATPPLEEISDLAPLSSRGAPLTHPAPLGDGDPWIAPAEAKESGYMDMAQTSGLSSPAAPPGAGPATGGAAQAVVNGAPGTARPTSDGTSSDGASASGSDPQATSALLSALAVGHWINLLVDGHWERTQLSWIGSQGNLFLFTTASGKTQSMTLRLMERLVQQGALQCLPSQAVVDGALDAVAHAALQNSADSRI